MADIDKALPNVETEIKVPGEDEIVEAQQETLEEQVGPDDICLLYTSPSPRDLSTSRMPSSA